jgi:hypothetical protein
MSRCYPHLSLEERRKIANWRYAKTLFQRLQIDWSETPLRSTVRSSATHVVLTINPN